MEEIEIWKQFADTDYEVSNHGEVKSNKRKTPLFMMPGIDKDGYFRVDVCHNHTIRHYHVHRLVALCFVENPYSLPQVNHKDGIKQNNYYKNLEWCTVQHNTIHAYAKGLAKGIKGERSSHAKIKEREAMEILLSSEPPEIVAPFFGVSITTVYDIRLRRSWVHL